MAALPNGLISVAGRAMGEDVADLADGDDGRPRAPARSSKVSSGGGIAKSLRLPVRVKPVSAVPRKGRAMTRPMRKGSTSRRTLRQSS
jgi:hypothetical protein